MTKVTVPVTQEDRDTAIKALIGVEDPIDALVDLLAPVLTHSQGMAARERESRFRKALSDLAARGAEMTEVTQEDYFAANAWWNHPVAVGKPHVDDLSEAFARHRIAADLAGYERGRRETVERIVAWLRKENGLCDCNARSAGECGCGAWDDYKQWPLERTADAIEGGEWK